MKKNRNKILFIVGATILLIISGIIAFNASLGGNPGGSPNKEISNGSEQMINTYGGNPGGSPVIGEGGNPGGSPWMECPIEILVP